MDSRIAGIMLLVCSYFILNQPVVFAEVPLPNESKKAYTLTQVETPGENTITKFEMVDGVMTPKYYRVDLAKTEYGKGNTSKYFEWTKNADGVNEFAEVSMPSGKKTAITALYNYSEDYDTTLPEHSRIEIKNNTAFPENPVVGNFIALSGEFGGAIYNNWGDIGNIDGNFIKNKSSRYGGAIYNNQAIDNISGKFIENSAYDNGGGAIWNYGVIEGITGSFINNFIDNTNDDAQGGAISSGNSSGSKIGVINADFIGNYASGRQSAMGGAVYNGRDGAIDTIQGDFVNNYVTSSAKTTSFSQGVYGGALYNKGTIGDIKGNFINNYIRSTAARAPGAGGAALYNRSTDSSYLATIGNITGNFIGNNIYLNGNTDSVGARGGAIENSTDFSGIVSIGDINGDFIGNSVETESQAHSASSGGAINISTYDNNAEKKATIGNITGNFIGNRVSAKSSVQTYANVNALGGAIYNSSSVIGDITGDFINNIAYFYSEGSSSYAYGGAIYNNRGTIGNITGSFIGNYAKGIMNKPGNAYAKGGAIVNEYGTFKNINGDFIKNDVKSSSEAFGGAIYNSDGRIESVWGDFIQNYTEAERTSYGGALYNYGSNGIVSELNGNFEENKAISKNSSAYGGAIYNEYGTIQNIDGNFINNSAEGVSSYGGAIYNSRDGKLNSIKGDFIHNHADAGANNYAQGGAIYNDSQISNIEGNFVQNYVSGTNYNAQGGAIYNTGTIKKLSSSFLGNYVISSNTVGGAIYNDGTLNIVADKNDIEFKDNFIAKEKDSEGNFVNKESHGIYNSYRATLNLNAEEDKKIVFNDKNYGSGTININMTGTSTATEDGNTLADNTPTKGTIVLNNDMSAVGGNVNIYDGTVKIGENGTFFSPSNTTVNGGSIDAQNNKTDTIKLGSFTLNADMHTKLDADLSDGGAMDKFNVSSVKGTGTITIDSINIIKDMEESVLSKELDFINTDAINTILADSAKSYMTSKYTYEINKTDDNTIAFTRAEDLGGFASAIANKPPVTEYFITVETEIIDKYSIKTDNVMQGNELNIHGNGNSLDGNGNKGVLINSGKVMNIYNVGSFNYEIADKNTPNSFAVTDKTGETKYYTVETSSGWNNFQNSAITNEGEISITDSVFTNNTGTLGGAINNKDSITEISKSVFVGNNANDFSTNTYSDAEGGAIANLSGTIGDINGDFLGNFASSNSTASGYNTNGANAIGGAIANISGTIGNLSGNFAGNYTLAVNSSSKANSITFAAGGAVSNGFGTIGTKDENSKVVGGIVNSNFINNYAKAETTGVNASAQGGAIYTTNDLNIIADNGSSLFRGNKTIVTTNKGTADEQTTETPNAIYVSSNRAVLKLQSLNNGTIQFDDQIDGEAGYTLQLTGDDKSKILLNNSVHNAKVTMDTTNVNLGKNDIFAASDVTVNSGTLGFVNGIAETQKMQSLNIVGNTNLALDVNLASETMDTLPDGTVVSPDANINVSYLNLLNDSSKDLTNIMFADSSYANQVSYTGKSPVAYTPIYRYDVSYNPQDGMFSFARGTSSSNQSDSFNPSVLSQPVATQAGAYTTQLQTFNYAFQHSDAFMNIPYIDRISIKNRNKYVLSPTGDATDVGTFSPLLTHEESAGIWMKPYASFESVPLKNGPKVSNVNYGTLVGFDSQLKSVSHGFDRVLTGYIGYNGASQRYQGVDAYQNGGILGGTATFYKNNFFNATTLSVGATAGDAKGMYGSENYTMLLAGIANKTGYNFELKEGRIIIQPSMLVSYSFVNTFDYNNAAGLRIKSDPLNAIQLAPGLKLIGNTKNGWQPYIGVSMIWNLLDKTRVTADDVRLPEMSIKPYVQYGVGVQKRWGDKFSAFGQAMLHSGGRNGVSLTCGLRWAVGKK